MTDHSDDYIRGWKAACSCVSDNIGVLSMAEGEEGHSRTVEVGDAVVRARRVVTKVARLFDKANS